MNQRIPPPKPAQRQRTKVLVGSPDNHTYVKTCPGKGPDTNTNA